MENNNKSTIVAVSIAIAVAIFIGAGFATHWFSMGVSEHTTMKEKSNSMYVK